MKREHHSQPPPSSAHQQHCYYMVKGSGTTNVGIVYGEGASQCALLGVDARVSYSNTYADGTTFHGLLSDQEIKIFQLNSQPNLFCSLMGDVENWHKMYTHMLTGKPTTPQEAYDIAHDYLLNIQRTNKRKLIDMPSFGTIIIGYNAEQVLELKSIFLKEKRIVTNEKNNEQQYAIGSGGYVATRFLLESNIYWKSATGESAEDAAFKALLCACLYDKYSGGYLTVTCLHGEGCITQTYTVLEVYNRCFEPAKEETTLFLLHSTSSDLILGEDSKITLLKDIWPKINLNSIRKWNMIAKKAYFYIYWLKLETKTEAEKFWSLVENCNPKPCFPQNLSHIRSKLVHYKRRDNRDDVYIGRSSKELVEGLCDLEDAKDLRY